MNKCLANRSPALSIIQYSRARYSLKPTSSEVKGGHSLCEPSFTLIKIPPYCPILGPSDEIVICLIRFSHLSNFVEFINPQVKHSFSLLRTPVDGRSLSP